MVSLSAQSLNVLRQRVPLFEGFTDAELTYLVGKSVRRQLKTGEQLIGDGALSTRLFIVVSGQANVFRYIGNREYLIACLNPGATVGEMGVVDCAPRSARVVAQGDTTILELEQGIFEEADPEVVGKLFRNIAAILARRVRESNDGLGSKKPEPEAPVDSTAVLDALTMVGISAKGANFEGSDFESANFERASFHGANFQNADLQAADLRGANLDGVLFDDDQLIGATADKVLVVRPIASEDMEQSDIDSLAATLIGQGETD